MWMFPVARITGVSIFSSIKFKIKSRSADVNNSRKPG